MKTIIYIALYELKHSLKSGKGWIFGLVFLLFSFLIINLFAGAFDSINISIAGENTKLNSQFMLSYLYSFLNMIGVILVAVLSSRMALKDLDYNSISLSYVLPVSKIHFLTGKYLAAFLMSAFVFGCAVIGVLLGTTMPYLDPDQFGPTGINNYLIPFISMVLPDVLFMSALFFMLGSIFRNYFVNWLAIILLYAIYYGAGELANKPDFSYLAGIIDPFGINAINNSEVGLSSEQLNSNDFDPNHIILTNRLFWMSLSILCFMITYYKFSFQYSIKKSTNKKIKKEIALQVNPSLKTSSPFSEKINISFSAFANLKKLLFLVKHEWNLLFKNFYFKTILFIGLIILAISAYGIGKIYDVNTYPITYNVSEVFLSATKLFLFVIITIFSGEMIWRDRVLNTHLVGDALPVNTTIKFLSKIIAMTIFVFVTHLAIMCFGLFVQNIKDYDNYEIAIYIQIILGVGFVNLIFTIGLAFFVQAIVSNRFVGYFIMLIYFCFKSFLANNILEDNTFNLNSAPFMQYSDMNVFGYNSLVFVFFKFYWLVFIVLLLTLANKFYPTGIDISFKFRFQYLKEQFRVASYRYKVVVLTSMFILCASFMYYNIHIKNKFESAYGVEKEQAEYEKKYSVYRHKVQPITTESNLDVALYPEDGSLKICGKYWLKNNSGIPISELYLNPMESDSVWFSVEASKTLDSKYFRVYKLKKSFAANDSIQLYFTLNDSPNGFSNNGVIAHVRKNGTFFNSDILPSIGYNEQFELQTNSRRRKFGLKERTLFAKPMHDKIGIATNMLGQKAMINMEMTVSTSSDQTVVAPGELIKKWSEKGRNYFTFKSSRPINNFYSVLSAKYMVKREVWESNDSLHRKVNLAIYHHHGHKYNLSTMMTSMKEALTYYEDNFSPFQYKELCIAEFPRYDVFAQSFSGCIPFSEGLGFIADLRGTNIDSASILDVGEVTIDYPFYVTAHEVAHQWWAHQVCAADVEGASFIIETLSQYSALMVMKKHYGVEKMRKFLNMEGFSYLSSRSHGTHPENPLLKVVSDETEVFYRKGSVIMYALQDYIGEEKVNGVLKKFVDKYAFKNAPYPTSLELVNNFESVTPDSLKYIINDWFRNITLYNNNLLKASYFKNENLEYVINYTMNIQKFSYDNNGKEINANVNDYIEIGIYNSKGKQVYLEKVKVKKGINNITLKLGRKPETIVLDPYNKLLDKDWSMKKLAISLK